MGLFDMNDDLLQDTFQDAVFRADGDVNRAENNPDVQQAVDMYVSQHDGCSYDDAWLVAAGVKSGNPQQHLSGGGSAYSYTNSSPRNRVYEYEIKAKKRQEFVSFILLLSLVFLVPFIIYRGWEVSLLPYSVIYGSVWSCMTVFIIWAKKNYYAQEQKQIEKEKKLINAKDYDGILAGDTIIKTFTIGSNVMQYRLRASGIVFYVVTIDFRDYYVDGLDRGEPQLIKETAASRNNEFNSSQEINIEKYNIALTEQYQKAIEQSGTKRVEFSYAFFSDVHFRYNELKRNSQKVTR